MTSAPPPRRPPRRRPRNGRVPPRRRVHVGRLGLTGPDVHAVVRPGGAIELVVAGRTSRRTGR